MPTGVRRRRCASTARSIARRRRCRCCARAVPATVINIGGLTAYTGASMRAHVVTAKAALGGLTRALAHELAEFGITVNCVVARHDRYRARRRERSGRARASRRSQALARAARPSRTKSPAPSCGWPAPADASPPARRCTSTAAPTWGVDHSFLSEDCGARASFGHFSVVFKHCLSERICWRRIGNLHSVYMGERCKGMRLAFLGSNDVLDANAPNKKCVANQRPMASPGNRFGTHQRAALAGRQFRDPLNVLGELRRLHVIRIAAKREIVPAGVEGIGSRVAQSPETRKMRIADIKRAQGFSECLAIELRIVT